MTPEIEALTTKGRRSLAAGAAPFPEETAKAILERADTFVNDAEGYLRTLITTS